MKLVSLDVAAPAPPALRRPRIVVGARVAVLLGLAGIAVAWLARPVAGGDAGPLMAGTESLGRCLAALDLVSCSQAGPIGPYPVLQYAPDLLADAGAELTDASRI